MSQTWNLLRRFERRVRDSSVLLDRCDRPCPGSRRTRDLHTEGNLHALYVAVILIVDLRGQSAEERLHYVSLTQQQTGFLVEEETIVGGRALAGEHRDSVAITNLGGAKHAH